MSDRFFTSDKNYMKRHPSSTAQDMEAPSVSDPTFGLYTSFLVIPHDLGYVPLVRTYYEPFNDGDIWPANGSRLAGFGPGLVPGDILCVPKVSDSNVTIYLHSTSSETGTIPIYCIIYLDND